MNRDLTTEVAEHFLPRLGLHLERFASLFLSLGADLEQSFLTKALGKGREINHVLAVPVAHIASRSSNDGVFVHNRSGLLD